MASIAIAPFHWAADLHSAFGMARKLIRRGHRVLFLCVPDAAPRVRFQGFEAREIFADAYPAGSVERQSLAEAQGRFGESGGFQTRLTDMCAALRAGELERVTESGRPDLLLVSSWTPWTAIAARRLGAPIVCFSSTLISVPDPIVPPFSSDLTPGVSRLFRLRTAWAWQRLFFGRRFLGEGVETRRELRALAGACGYPPKRIDFRVETWPRLEFPEIVLCPRQFDLPRARPPAHVEFVEASVDPERKDPDFPWDRLDAGRPLVYVSTGSVLTVKFRSEADRVLQAVLDAASARPAWQFVATCGRHSELARFRVPSNALLVPVAPQLELLKRAALHVTHAGLTSVKESLLAGVPMVALPRFYDQKGNAARVLYHGLGLVGDWSAIGAEDLGRLMDRVMSEPGFTERARAMSREFTAQETASRGVEIVEHAARGGRANPHAGA